MESINTTPQQPPMQPVKSSKPNMILLVVICILLLGLGLAGGYILRGSNTPAKSDTAMPTTPPSPTDVSLSPTTMISPTTTIELKSYTSTQLANNALKPYMLSYPATWTLNTDKTAITDTTTITKDTYEIKIYQAPMDGGMCTFEGTPPDGPGQDLRNKAFVQIDTAAVMLRRFEKTTQPDPNTITIEFCTSTNGKDYGSPTQFGAITYKVPKNPSSAILTEMDTIIKSLKEAK